VPRTASVRRCFHSSVEFANPGLKELRLAKLKIEHLCWYCTANSETHCRLISIHFVLARPGDLSKGHVQDLAHAQRRLVATGFEIEGYIRSGCGPASCGS
jgi:hypothetical protein